MLRALRLGTAFLGFCVATSLSQTASAETDALPCEEVCADAEDACLDACDGAEDPDDCELSCDDSAEACFDRCEA